MHNDVEKQDVSGETQFTLGSLWKNIKRVAIGAPPTIKKGKRDEEDESSEVEEKEETEEKPEKERAKYTSSAYESCGKASAKCDGPSRCEGCSKRKE